eukprot:TRINITY_DN3949_c0_g1_i2.p1 TRINITY_DN3949_c0_g1~~TRINITY_DN3949_c0_g1_i2.p1  ORF type:complete len:361 (-),score=31.75 TRINITY_DN3949_c0_g1_i2:62-1144(-)
MLPSNQSPLSEDDDECVSPLSEGKSPRTNGFLVRFVGRRRILDSTLHTVSSVVAWPCFLCQLVRARYSRESWKETCFQLFSVGSTPTVCVIKPCSSSEVTDRRISETVSSLTPSIAGSVRFVFISDTHMEHESLPCLPPGDVLVHTGDFTNHGSFAEVQAFAQWMSQQPHPFKLVVPGNHDFLLDADYYEQYWSDWSTKKESTDQAIAAFKSRGVKVLMDDVIEIKGVTVAGSPWVTRYAEWRTGFNKTPEEMQRHWESWQEQLVSSPLTKQNPLIILTHMPPKGIGDREPNGRRNGCPHLMKMIQSLRPALHAFGHNHSDAGFFTSEYTTFLNATSVCDYYRVGGRSAYVVDLLTNGNH